MPETEKKPKLKLVGEDGNAFAIMGRAKEAARKAKWSPEKVKEYLDKCREGDYNHLLVTTMEYFDVR